MGEHLWFLGGLALAILGWVLSHRAPRPPLTPLGQATLRSMANRLSVTRGRLAELVRVNEELSQELARLGRLRDKAQLEVEELKDRRLEERDELAQRLRQCVCTVGPALAEELEEDGRG